MVVGVILLGGGLIVSGIAAAGYLADEIGQALQQTGQLRNFENQGEVAMALVDSGRADLAQKLLLAQTQTDLAAFNVQSGRVQVEQTGSITNLALAGVAAFVAFKVLT